MKKVLLDTHAMLWWWTEPGKLPAPVLNTLQSPRTEIFASAVSACELSYKHHLGKLTLPADLLDAFEEAVAAERWTPLPVSTTHCLLAGRLSSSHRDPFDRLLAAQAMTEKLALVSVDAVFTGFAGLKVFWKPRLP